MAYLRLIRPHEWHRRQQRFTRLAFHNSTAEYGGGISVVDQNCAQEQNGTVCAHIGRHYGKFGSPVLFWLIKEGTLPEHQIAPEPEDADDPCHRNLIGIPDETAESLIKKDFEANQFANFLICEDAGVAHLVDAEVIERWQSAHGL